MDALDDVIIMTFQKIKVTVLYTHAEGNTTPTITILILLLVTLIIMMMMLYFWFDLVTPTKHCICYTSGHGKIAAHSLVMDKSSVQKMKKEKVMEPN